MTDGFPERARLLLAITGALLAGPTAAAVRPDVFPLGQSAKTGAVCQAVRDFEDPAVQRRGAAAWSVRCRGWDGSLGRLYAFERGGPAVLAPDGAWSGAVKARATCPAPTALSLAGVAAAKVAACQSVRGQTAYVVYTGARGHTVVAGDGLAPLADLLQAGVRIVAGAAQPPARATDTQAAAVSAGATTDSSGAGSLSAAADSSQTSAETVRERGYAQNQAWLFSNAEGSFRSLALDAAAAPRDRAEAYYNWALNVSNLGRFKEADRLFKEGDDQAARTSDAALIALGLNYQALHARNQRDFAAAADLAQRAIEQRRRLDRGGAGGQALELQSGSSKEITISGPIAAALNRRDRARATIGGRGMTAEERLEVQDAQAWYIIGSCKAALGDKAGAITALDTAQSLLAGPTVLNSAAWLRAQTDAELARIDLAESRPADAKARLADALATLRRRSTTENLVGSQAEAGLLLEYARAEAAAGDKVAALQDFDRGLAEFREARGSLGASADAAGVYFDLLIKQRAAEPARARELDQKFFTAAQSIVTEATADTVARLAARMNQGDTVSAGVARALEDTRRQIRVQQAEMQQAQTAGTLSGAALAHADAQLKALQDEAAKLEGQLLVANPRYGQLVIATASLDDMQKHLQPGEAYLKIVLLGPQGFGLFITHDAVTPYEIPLSRARAEAEVRLLRKPFDANGSLPRFDVARSHKLYQDLLGPAAGDMAQVRHLIFDPDGALISLPAAVLVADDRSVQLMADRLATLKKQGGGVLSYAGVGWLGRSTDTSLVVSAASFIQSRDLRPSAAPNPFLGFADAIIGSPDDPHTFASVVGAQARAAGAGSDYCESQRRRMAGMRRLTETADEVASVAESLGAGPGSEVTGAAFTDASVRARKDLDQFRVVYFATHGLLPVPGACLPQPALVTSVGPVDSDGLLDAVQILDLKLDADLVVLSACNTGGGGATADATGLAGSGEALGGLTRAFIYAGSRGLIVSHWEVDSKATLALMTGMFGAAKPGIGQSEALRQAELKLMDTDGVLSHPYYWAAFTVVGDGARALPVSGRAGPVAQVAGR